MDKKGKISVIIPEHPPNWENFIWNNKEKVIYGPVDSRRLGKSLGINLFPSLSDGKICSFNCIYCDCGYNTNNIPRRNISERQFITTEQLNIKIKEGLEYYLQKKIHIDYITFAGNGEPTLYPSFPKIVTYVINLRNELFPDIPIAIFTNSSTISNHQIIESIMRLDERIFKLDAGEERTFELVNQPIFKLRFEKLFNGLRRLNNIKISSAVIVSPNRYSNFLSLKSEKFIEILKTIKPAELHLYSIDYPSAFKEVKRIELLKMIELAEFVTDHIHLTGKVLQTREPCPIDLEGKRGNE